MAATNWTFVWSPAGAGGPITFHAAVAVGHDISSLQRACLHDQRDGAGPVTMDVSHMDHGRRLRSRQPDGVPFADVYQACPGRMIEGPHTMSMGGPVWSTASTAAPLLFPGADLDTPGRFAGAGFASFFFAAASSAVGAWATAVQERGAAPGGPRWHAAAGAFGGLLRHAGHYACMLVSMSYNVWLLLALMGGHATAYAAAALLTRRREAARQALGEPTDGDAGRWSK